MSLQQPLARLLGLVLLTLALQACRPDEPDPMPPACGPSNCEGCCRVDGRCMAGTALTLCGRGGEQCQSCSGTQVCGAGVCAAPPDAGNTPDAGLPDAGNPPPDAGDLPDAGSPPDAGAPDGGSGDGGVDAGGPSGIGCSDPIPLKVVDGGAYMVGDTTGHGDLGAGPCGGAGGGDVVYELQMPPRSGNMVVTVEPLSSGGLQPVVYMGPLCDTPRYCVAAGTEKGTATLVSPTPSSGGKYYLWVDGAPGSAGPYSIRVASFNNLGESCGSPIELPFGAGEANLSVAETSWVHDTHGSCETWTSSGDHVYRMTVDRVQNLEVRVSATSFLGNTYLRTVCGGGELACTGGNVIRRQELAPGTYYLWRDSPGGTYDLYAHLSDPLPGDSCSTVNPLVFSDGEEGGSATVTGTTEGMFDNDLSGCGTRNTPDLVYTFTTSKTLDFRASAAGHRLTLRSATCSGTQVACGADDLAVGALPPGTYYLWLDTSTASPFTLSASLTPAAPGDTCASPEPLVFSGGSLGGDAEARGNLSTRFHNSSGSCGGVGADHVYAFTTSTPLNFRASSSSGYVYLRSGDCSSGTELACGYYSTIEATGLAAGTYHLWVDSTSSGASSYILRAALTPPLCQEPLPLVFRSGDDGGTALVATASGNTASAFSTTQGSCGGSGGQDVVYAFELTEPRRLDVKVTSDTSGFRPVVYLRASCDADELACAVAPPVSYDATLSSGPLPPGKYFLWVDGFTGTAGVYALTATLN